MITPPPPPPNHAPTVGLDTTWWSQTAAIVWPPERITAAETAQQRLAASMDELSRAITETPDERRRRLHAEEDAMLAAEGETPRQRVERHRDRNRAERHRSQRAATRVWKASPGEQARRFRRWCAFTVLSASAGYSVGLVQWVSTLPTLVSALIALPAAYWLDLRLRGGWNNAIRITDLRGWRNWRPISSVLIARVPVASVLASLLHLNALLAASGHLLHHH